MTVDGADVPLAACEPRERRCWPANILAVADQTRRSLWSRGKTAVDAETMSTAPPECQPDDEVDFLAQAQ